MVIKPHDLENAQLPSVDEGGLDPEAVSELLAQAAARIRELELDGIRAIGGTVGEMLDQAVKSGEVR
jgi:hypothetical protein